MAWLGYCFRVTPFRSTSPPSSGSSNGLDPSASPPPPPPPPNPTRSYHCGGGGGAGVGGNDHTKNIYIYMYIYRIDRHTYIVGMVQFCQFLRCWTSEEGVRTGSLCLSELCRCCWGRAGGRRMGFLSCCAYYWMEASVDNWVRDPPPLPLPPSLPPSLPLSLSLSLSVSLSLSLSLSLSTLYPSIFLCISK